MKVVVAVKDSRRGCAVLELQEGGIGPLGRPAAIPDTRLGPNGSHGASRNQPNDVEMVASLSEDHPSAEAAIELRGHPAAIDPVGVVPAIDHAQTPQAPALD